MKMTIATVVQPETIPWGTIVFGAMIGILLTATWNIIFYLIKKKDKKKEQNEKGEHEAISNINSSIGEIRTEQKEQKDRLESIDGHLTTQDYILDDHTLDIRDMAEAFRSLERELKQEFKRDVKLMPPPRQPRVVIPIKKNN